MLLPLQINSLDDFSGMEKRQIFWRPSLENEHDPFCTQDLGAKTISWFPGASGDLYTKKIIVTLIFCR